MINDKTAIIIFFKKNLQHAHYSFLTYNILLGKNLNYE